MNNSIIPTMRNAIVVSFDLATTTGYARHKDMLGEVGGAFREGCPWILDAYGEFDVSSSKGKRKALFSEAFRIYEGMLYDAACKVSTLEEQSGVQGRLYVVYEDVRRWSSSSAAKRYCGLLAVLEHAVSVVAESDVIVDLYGIAPTQIKKHLTGNGRASKQDVIQAVERAYDIGGDRLTDNEADAIAAGTIFIDERIHSLEGETK